jgi:hypothetical protein
VVLFAVKRTELVGADEDELELDELELDCAGLHATAPIIIGTARQRERQTFLNNFIIFHFLMFCFIFLYIISHYAVIF